VSISEINWRNPTESNLNSVRKFSHILKAGSLIVGVALATVCIFTSHIAIWIFCLPLTYMSYEIFRVSHNITRVLQDPTEVRSVVENAASIEERELGIITLVTKNAPFARILLTTYNQHLRAGQRN
jgi:hypothetical protein